MLMRLVALHRLLDTSNAKEGEKKKSFAQFMAFYLAVYPQIHLCRTREKYTIVRLSVRLRGVDSSSYLTAYF